MARFRDIKNMNVFGTPWTGVQDASVDLQADSFDSASDDDVDIKRVDVTKQKIALTINILDPAFKRDIKNIKFTGSPELNFNEVLQCSLAENCETINDSSEDDQWITYVGIKNRSVEGEMELRDISQLLDEAEVKIGDGGVTFQFDVMPGLANSGLANASAYERFYIYNAVITSIKDDNKHGDLATATVSLKGYGDNVHTSQIYNTLSGGGSSGFEKHTGDSGTITFTAPAALGGSGGDKDITIANCVLTKVEIVAKHAGRLERKFTFEAYSSDGHTSPLTIA